MRKVKGKKKKILNPRDGKIQNRLMENVIEKKVITKMRTYPQTSLGIDEASSANSNVTEQKIVVFLNLQFDKFATLKLFHWLVRDIYLSFQLTFTDTQLRVKFDMTQSKGDGKKKTILIK